VLTGASSDGGYLARGHAERRDHAGAGCLSCELSGGESNGLGRISRSRTAEELSMSRNNTGFDLAIAWLAWANLGSK
jgi:hypothetical protein